MSTVTEAVRARRSVRAFLDRPVAARDDRRNPDAGRARALRRQSPALACRCAGRGARWPTSRRGSPPASPPIPRARAPSSRSIRRRWASRGAAAASPRASSSMPRSAFRARTGRRGLASSRRISICSARRSASSSRSRAIFDRPQWAHLGMFMQNVMLLAAGARPRHLRAGSLGAGPQDVGDASWACPRTGSSIAAWRSALPTKRIRSTAGGPSASRSRTSRSFRGF